MASKYSIQAVFKLIDNVSAPLDRIAGKGNKVGRALKNDFISAQKTVDNAGASLKKFAGYAVAAGAALVGIGIGVATKQFIDFDNALHKAGAVFSDLDSKSSGFNDSLKNLGMKARNVAAATEFNAQQTANALASMAMAGIESNQAMALLGKTADLATAACIDLDKASGMTADTLGIFNLISDKMPIAELEKNFGRISDIMAKTASLANQDINMVFSAMGNSGAFFNKGNQEIEHLGALIDGLASNAIKGEAAGTTIKNIMLGLSNIKTDKAAQSLKVLGIDRLDENGNLRNIVDIIGQFEKGIKGMGDVEINTHLNEIFGREAITGVMALIGVGSEKLKYYTNKLVDAGGATEQMAAVMRNSLQNRIEVLKSALMELGFKFVEAFQEKGSDIIVKLTDAITKFDPASMISALTTTAEIIGNVIQTAWKLRYIILGIAIAWGVYKAGMLGAAIVSPIITLVKAIKMLAAGQSFAAVKQWVLNAAMTANPIGLIITGIGILIGLIIALVMNWEKVCNIINENQNIVLALIRIFAGPFGIIFSIINELRNNWGLVVETFKTDGIIKGFLRLGGVILSAMIAPIQGFLELLAKIPGVGKLLGPVVNKLDTLRANLKGTEENVEKPILPRPPARQRTATNPAAAANTAAPVANTTTPPAITRPVVPPAAPPVLSRPSPSPVPASVTANSAGSQAVHQATLLDLRSPVPGGMVSPALTASETTAPVITAAETSGSAISSGPAASVTRSTAPVKVPVEYVFSEMIIPPEIIKPVVLPVELDFGGYLPPMVPQTAIAAPGATQTTTSGGFSPAEAITRPAMPPVDFAPVISPLKLPLSPAAPIKVPVEYVFSEMIIPLEIIKPIVLPVELDFGGYLPPMAPQTVIAAPGATQTITSGILPAEAVTRAAMPPQTPPVDFAPAVSSLKLPLSPAAPVSGSIAESITPPVLPMTQAEQIIYSRSENYENVNITVSPEAGASARITKHPKAPNVKLTISGDA